MTRFPRLAFVAVVLASCSEAPVPPPAKTAAPLRVVVFHTADLHGRVDRLPSLAAFIAGERRRLGASGARVLHVDAGDFFQGTPEGDLTRGRAVLDAYNAIGVDALAVGNHDFDLGPTVTGELARAARFPFLAANLRLADGRGPPAWARPSAVVPGARIEFLGLAPDRMDRLSPRRARDGLDFGPAASAIAAHQWSPGVARILVTHLGIERDRELPARGVAAILGGHTHVTAVETLPGGAILLHPGSHGRTIGRLELALDPGTGAVRAARGEVLEVPDGRDGEIERAIEARAGDVRRRMDEVVGRVAADLPRGGPDFDGISSPLGSHVADLARRSARAEAAVILRSSIRGSLAAGPVRRRDLYEALPFPDEVVAIELTGARLRSALERGVAGDDRILVEVSGLAMSYDPAAPAGRRIRRLDVAGAPLDPRRRYRVATLAFMAEPGGLLAGRADIQATGRTPLDLLAEWVADSVPATPGGPGIQRVR